MPAVYQKAYMRIWRERNKEWNARLNRECTRRYYISQGHIPRKATVFNTEVSRLCKISV